MFQIVIFSKQSQATMLWFRAREKAELQFQNIQMVLAGKIDTDNLTEKDEFGAILNIPTENVSHCIFNDMTKQAELFKLLESIGYAKKS